MISPRFRLLLLTQISAIGLFQGCDGPNTVEAEYRNAPALRMQQNGPSDQESKPCPKEENPGGATRTMVLKEEWDFFDETLWVGDGDQGVSGGYFHALASSPSAVADYLSPTPVLMPAQGSLLFSNQLQLMSHDEVLNSESGALFMVNSDSGGVFDNFVFVHVGYTPAPSKIYVELFGSNHGEDFDQVFETSLPYSDTALFSVDLWMHPNAYQVEVAGEMLDKMPLTHPIASMRLFEVGVFESRIHATSISQVMSEPAKNKPHHHRFFKHKPFGKRIGAKRHARNDYIRLARQRIKHTENPSLGMQCLAKMRERQE